MAFVCLRPLIAHCTIVREYFSEWEEVKDTFVLYWCYVKIYYNYVIIYLVMINNEYLFVYDYQYAFKISDELIFYIP